MMQFEGRIENALTEWAFRLEVNGSVHQIMYHVTRMNPVRYVTTRSTVAPVFLENIMTMQQYKYHFKLSPGHLFNV